MNDWKKDPRLQHISPEKLALLEKLSENMKGKSPTQAMPLLLAALTSAREKGLKFSDSDTALIIELLEQNAPEQEKEKIKRMLHLFQQMNRK